MSDFDTAISTSSIPSDVQNDFNVHLLNFGTNEELNRKTRLTYENRCDFSVEELGKKMYVDEEIENEHLKGSESSCLSIKVKERKRLMVLPETEDNFHVHQSSSVSNIASLLNEAKNFKKLLFLRTPVSEHKIINDYKISDSVNCDTERKSIESPNIAFKERLPIPPSSGKIKTQRKLNSHENAVPPNTRSTQGNSEFLNNSSSVSLRCKRPLSPVKCETKFGSKQSRKTISSTISDCAENPPKIMSARNMLYGTTDKMNDTGTSGERFNNHLESNAAEKTKQGGQKKDDEDMINTMLSEILNTNPNVKFEDIAGLEFVKTTVREIVIWPFLRPDIFCGLRAPPKGVLLFGPPGTGKTLIGKCIATESNATFFCISASSLTSKYVGEGEKLVRTLFAVARSRAPSVIFIDEIDSLLSQRCGGEQDYSRKLKTEFLVQFDGAKTSNDDRILVVGATNRPQELDEAARRRFVKRLYVPLPDLTARHQIVTRLISKYTHQLSASDMDKICCETEGYSCADISNLCKEASMGPIRSNYARLETISLDELRAINVSDFKEALERVKSSVSKADIDAHLEFNKTFGCGNSV